MNKAPPREVPLSCGVCALCRALVLPFEKSAAIVVDCASDTNTAEEKRALRMRRGGNAPLRMLLCVGCARSLGGSGYHGSGKVQVVLDGEELMLKRKRAPAVKAGVMEKLRAATWGRIFKGESQQQENNNEQQRN